MNKKEFQKIEKLLEKAEDEALNEGVDITSAKFQSLLEEIKTKILREKGITLEEYKEMESEIDIDNEKADINSGELMKLAERIEKDSKIKKEKSKEEKDKFDRNIKRLQEEHFVEIDKLAQELNRKIKATEEKQLKEGDIKQLIPKVKYYDKEIQHLSKKIDNIRIPEQQDWTEQIDSIELKIKTEKKDVEKMVKQETKKQLNDALKPSLFGKPKILNKKDIDKQIKAYIKENLQIRIPYGGGRNFQFADGETPTGDVDGSNKVFTLAYTPDPLTSLAVYVNTTRKTLTTDYTLSGTTLTMDSAPRSGAILICDYRY